MESNNLVQNNRVSACCVCCVYGFLSFDLILYYFLFLLNLDINKRFVIVSLIIKRHLNGVAVLKNKKKIMPNRPQYKLLLNFSYAMGC